MSQQVINISNIGDPAVQAAFTQTNQNFTQIWASGPVDSNIEIVDNTIQATNLNGNIIINTLGTGVVQFGTSIIPDQGNARMLGSAQKPFNTVYTQYVTATSATVSGNLYVPGNLLVSGNTIYVNRHVLNLGNSTIVLSANATYPAMADGSGLLVRGAGATFTYSAINQTWNSNLPVAAPAFVGDGSQLTNVSAAINGASVSGNVLASTVLYSNLNTVGTLANLTVTDYVSATGNITGNVITGSYLIGNGSGITNVTANAIVGQVANATYANIAGTAESANLAALATQAVNADTALLALNATNANNANTSNFAQLANVANTACIADVANSAVVAGRAHTIDAQTSITVTGNVLAGNLVAGNITGTITSSSQPFITQVGTLTTLSVAGNIAATSLSLTGNIYANAYFYANGAPFIGGGGPGNYSNANVAAFLPYYSGDLNTVYNLSAYGNVSFANTLTVGNSITTRSTISDNYFYGNGVPLSSTQGVFGDQQFYGYNITGPYPLQLSTDNNNVIVSVNGLTMAPVTYYNVVGNTITFTDVMATTDLIDVRFLGQGSVLADQQFRGDNTVGPFNLSRSATANSVIVTINGLTQAPDIATGGSYSISPNGLGITFIDAVAPTELVDIRYLAVGNTGGFNWLANTITFNNDTVQSTAYQVVAPPLSSIGQTGDLLGMVAYDTNYSYYCTDNYDGNTDIWRRVAWDGTTW